VRRHAHFLIIYCADSHKRRTFNQTRILAQCCLPTVRMIYTSTLQPVATIFSSECFRANRGDQRSLYSIPHSPHWCHLTPCSVHSSYLQVTSQPLRVRDPIIQRSENAEDQFSILGIPSHTDIRDNTRGIKLLIILFAPYSRTGTCRNPRLFPAGLIKLVNTLMHVRKQQQMQGCCSIATLCAGSTSKNSDLRLVLVC
jgi:hypothetical protein